MSTDIELASLAAAHYGRPERDIPALVAFERHRAEQAKIPGMPGLHGAIPNFIAGFHAGQAAAIPQEQAEDSARLDWLSVAVEDGCVTSCFEIDGGIHLTLDPVGGEQKAYRNMDNLRAAVDAARAKPEPK